MVPKLMPLLPVILLSCQLAGQPGDEWEMVDAGITEALHDVEFFNDSTGIIYSYGTGNIYRTTDGGCTWNRVWRTDSIYLEQVQFISPRLGWICGEMGTVLRTEDGGETWKDLSIREENVNLLLYGMCFINDSTGFVSGAVLGDGGLEPRLFQTTDGGGSWSRVLWDIPYMILNLYHRGSNLFATGDGIILKIGISADKWEYAFRDTTRVVGQIRDIRFAGDSLGLGVSFNGLALVTRDGGDTFTINPITINRLRSITCLGHDSWIIAGDQNKRTGGNLFRTRNNGESWETVGNFPDIHRIGMSGKYLWIVGREGLIARQKR